ncbi:MAG: divalent metal cation transporter, partial [Bacteroidota bacterium]
MRKSLASILFWLVISAAFIGPGTVATAAKAGATYGSSLIWALLFSVAATYLLQEAAARIPLLSGKNLGQALQETFQGPRGKWLNRFLAVAVILGCAAYEAGNILGAVADDRYSAEIASLAQTGPGVISPKEIRGLIAFPSYHTVLA